jgi:hypothetical protein
MVTLEIIWQFITISIISLNIVLIACHYVFNDTKAMIVFTILHILICILLAGIIYPDSKIGIGIMLVSLIGMLILGCSLERIYKK